MREEAGHRVMGVVVGAGLLLGGLIAVCTGAASGSRQGRWEVTGWPGRMMGVSMIAAGLAVLRALRAGGHEDVWVVILLAAAGVGLGAAVVAWMVL